MKKNRIVQGNGKRAYQRGLIIGGIKPKKHLPQKTRRSNKNGESNGSL